MGTDIRLHVEYREVVAYSRNDRTIQELRRSGEDLKPYEIYSPWKIGGKELVLRDQVFEGHGYEGEGSWDRYWVFDPKYRMFSGDRNYALFAWLTNVVRRYALDRLAPGVVPIVDGPRGLPEGGCLTDYDVEHTPSWVHVSELLQQSDVLEEHFPDWLEAALTWQHMDARVVFWFES